MKLDYSFLNGQTKTEYSEFNHVIEHLDQEETSQSNDIVNLSLSGSIITSGTISHIPNQEFTSKNIMINFEIMKELDDVQDDNVLRTENCNILEKQKVDSSNSDRNQYILYVRAVNPGNCAIIASDPRNSFEEIGRVNWKYAMEIGSGILSKNPQSIFGLNLEMFKEDEQRFGGFYGNNEISRKKMFISVPTSKEEFKVMNQSWEGILKKIEDLDETTIKEFINKEGSCGKNVTKINNPKILTNYILYFEEKIPDFVDPNSGFTSYDINIRYLIFYENKIYYPKFDEVSDSYQHIPELSNILPELPILKAEYQDIALIVKNLKGNGNVLDTTVHQKNVSDYLELAKNNDTDAMSLQKEIMTYPNSFSSTIFTFDIELEENLFEDEEYDPLLKPILNPNAAPSKIIVVDVDIEIFLNKLIMPEGQDINPTLQSFSRQSLKEHGIRTELSCDYYGDMYTGEKHIQPIESPCAQGGKEEHGCCADKITKSNDFNNTNCEDILKNKIISIKINNNMFGYKKFYEFLHESVSKQSFKERNITISAGQLFIYILKFANYFCDKIIAYRTSFARQMTQLKPVRELDSPPKLDDIEDLNFPIEDYITRNMSEEEKEKWITDNGRANVKDLFSASNYEPIVNDEETNKEDEFSKWMGLLAENEFGLKNPEIDFMGKVIQINKIFTKNKMHSFSIFLIFLILTYMLGIEENNWLKYMLVPLINEVKVYNDKVKNLTPEQRNTMIKKLIVRSELIRLNNDKIESFEDEAIQALAENINRISSSLELEKVLVNDTMEDKIQVIEEETIVEEETIIEEKKTIIEEETIVEDEDKDTSSTSVVPWLEKNEVTLQEEEEFTKKAGGISNNLILIILIILLAYLLIVQ